MNVTKPDPLARLAAATAIAVLSFAGPLAAEIIIPEGDARAALRVTDGLEPIGRIEGLGAVHGMDAAPSRGLLVAGSLDEQPRGAAARPEGVSAADHAAHHGKGAAAPAEGDVSIVSLVDLASGKTVRRIETPGMVHHVAVGASDRYALVTHPALDAVSVIDLESGAVAPAIPTGANPNYAVYDDVSGSFYVSNAGDATISKVDPARGIVVGVLATPGGVEHMAIDVAGRRLYGAEAETGRVDEIDLDAGEVIRSFDVGGALHGIAANPAANALYVSAREQGRIAWIDLASGSVTLTDAGPEPYHMALDGDLLVVSSAEDDVVWGFDAATRRKVAEVATRARGHQMVVLPK